MLIQPGTRADRHTIMVAPGVRIEHLRPRRGVIVPDDDSVAAFVGLSSRGPLIGAHPIESWAEFRDRFGESAPGAFLPDAVRGFFSNGGRIAFVARVGSPGDDPGPDGFLGFGPERERPSGMAAVLSVDNVRLIAVPDLSSTLSPEACVSVYRTLLDRVEEGGDRLVIIDGPRASGAEEMIAWAARLRSSSAVIYAPWIKVASEDDGRARAVPPCGHLAGSYARTERSRGIHWPPANVVIHGAVDLESGAGETEDFRLVSERINMLRADPARGIRALGARTLAGEPVHVRRLLISIRGAIRSGTEWVVFEPRTEASRKAVTRTVRSYLERLWRTGALAGATPDEAFCVDCRTAESDTEDGILICQVGVAPVRPAEFVVIRIQHRYDGGRVSTEGEEGNLAK